MVMIIGMYWWSLAIIGSQWRSTAAASMCKHALVSVVEIHHKPMDSNDLPLSQDITASLTIILTNLIIIN